MKLISDLNRLVMGFYVILLPLYFLFSMKLYCDRAAIESELFSFSILQVGFYSYPRNGSFFCWKTIRI